MEANNIRKQKKYFYTISEKEEKEKIIDYVEASISNSVPLNYHIVVTHIISMNLDPLKDILFKAKYKRVVRLLKNNYFVIRKSTHIGQSIPYDANVKHFIF